MLHKYLPGSIRERIQDLLLEHNMTQAQLAERISKSESTLNRFLSGQTDKLSGDNVMAITGICAKLISGNINYVLIAYVLNLVMVSLNLVVYFRNVALDKKRAQTDQQ